MSQPLVLSIRGLTGVLGIVLAAFIFSAELSSPAAAMEICHSDATDPDGDGWGWEDTDADGYPNSCRVVLDSAGESAGESSAQNSASESSAQNSASSVSPEDSDCDYSHASVNNGYGWNPITQQSCDPLAELAPGVVFEPTPEPIATNVPAKAPGGGCVRTPLSDATNPNSVSVDITNGERFNITRGTCNEDTANTIVEANAGERRGLRTYCMVSHYSYEDPIVNPSGTKHLHMFWGNTGTNETTTVVDPNASSTCEGGTRNLSAYWMPALFDGNGNVVLPRQVITYYKSFAAYGSGGETTFGENAIQDIPEGLHILAEKKIPSMPTQTLTINDCDYLDTTCWRPRVEQGQLSFKIKMPQCIKVDTQRNPILVAPVSDKESGIFNSHLAYASGDANQANLVDGNYCPNSHPYRIPQVELVANYSTQGLGDWRLASDIQMGMPAGSTLHADYVAGWERDTFSSAMSFMVRCNQNNDSCEHGDGHAQLPERFESAWGSILYGNGADLLGGILRPFTGAQPAPIR